MKPEDIVLVGIATARAGDVVMRKAGTGVRIGCWAKNFDPCFYAAHIGDEQITVRALDDKALVRRIANALAGMPEGSFKITETFESGRSLGWHGVDANGYEVQGAYADIKKAMVDRWREAVGR